jgi:hypothetical protein
MPTRGEIDVPVKSFDFGQVPVLNPRIQEVEVRNLGRASILISDLSLQEPDGPFRLLYPIAPFSLEGGSVVFVQVGFRPPKAERYEATLLVKSEYSITPEVEIGFVGTGFTAAHMAVSEAIDFGEVCGGTTAVQHILVQASGDADLLLEQIQFQDPVPEFEFVSSVTTPAKVPPGETLSIGVRYAPTESSPASSIGAVVIAGADPDRPQVTVPLTGSVNRAPLASIADTGEALPGDTVVLDGSGSSDPDANLPLTWAWQLLAWPAGSQATLTSPYTPQPSLALDRPGLFTVELAVSDDKGCSSKPVFQDVLAKASQQVRVMLVWDQHDPDLDLHLVPDGRAFFGPLDCYFAEGHMSPNWGAEGDASDNPLLDRDALTGFGPEIISYANPASGRYKVMVHYYSGHGANAPATEATVRVYLFGVVYSETTRSLTAADQRWTVLSIDWPSQVLTPIDTLE